MRKGILAMESAEAQASAELDNELTDVALPTESELQTVDNNEAELAGMSDQIAETEDISETLDGMNESLAPLTEEGAADVSPEEANALALVTENLASRLGYRGQSKFPSLESFKTQDRNSAIKLAIEHHKRINAVVKPTLVLAQEGFFAKLGDSLDYLFTFNSKLRKLNQETAKKFDAGTPKTEPIVNPGWGRFLNPDSKTDITARDVIARLQSFKVQNLDSVIDKVNKITAFIQKAGRVVDESWFVANKEQLARMQQMSNELTQEVDALKQLYPPIPRKGSDGTFAPLDASSKSRLVSEIDHVLLGKDLGGLVETYEGTWDQIHTIIDNAETRISGHRAADIKILEQMFQKSGQAIHALYDAYNFRHRLGHAAIKYMQASIG